jgi:hypothetical protein
LCEGIRELFRRSPESRSGSTTPGISPKRFPRTSARFQELSQETLLAESRFFTARNKTANTNSAPHSDLITDVCRIQTQPIPGFIQEVTTALHGMPLSLFRRSLFHTRITESGFRECLAPTWAAQAPPHWGFPYFTNRPLWTSYSTWNGFCVLRFSQCSCAIRRLT